MKKIVCLTTLLVAVSLNASADSFDNLIKDANSRLSFVEASGNCNVSYDGNEPNCQPVIAKCPTGTKILPLSKCSASARINNEYDMSISADYFADPFVLSSDTMSDQGQQKCSIGLGSADESTIAWWKDAEVKTLKVKSKAVCTKLSNATETSVKKLLGKISN